MSQIFFFSIKKTIIDTTKYEKKVWGKGYTIADDKASAERIIQEEFPYMDVYYVKPIKCVLTENYGIR